MKIRRLKIFQQLLIVFLIAVLLPLFITTLVVTNVNQQAVRAQLRYSAIITADNVYQRLNLLVKSKKEIDVKSISKELFKYLVNDQRQVYIIDSKKNIIISYNADKELFKTLLPELPKTYKFDDPIIFGHYKNLPNVFLKLKEPDWAIIVATPQEQISYGIISARNKIITAIVVAGFFIIVLGLLYTYSLNANFKQLIKAISAIASGNYRRRMRLIKDFFTPQEFAYLVEKFNDMASRIDESYNELCKLDKLKSNLIDTISHEFRTPLTSIRGYASRLLRNDINLDEETRIKSLKIIKQQAERFSRLVDDLLVVPEIESELLRVFPQNISLKDIFEDCILSLQHKQTRKIKLNISENFPDVYADPDRLTQVIINILDNALKYSPEGSVITVNIAEQQGKALVEIHNQCESISEEKLGKLFEKFTRLEEDLTRTTRGTGLGLFIVKGLINAMGGEIFLKGDDGFTVSFSVPYSAEE